ncbi:MAG TPA: hypothetical protein VGN95_10755 [Pyrinomonadaceae bacterium]|jgi:hypothetical protein|nr:hypothetical protein [Pyrinomonadaceae bacterium]
MPVNGNLEGHPTDPVEALRTLDMKERYNNADIVLTGRVVNVQLPFDSINAAVSAADPFAVRDG